MRRKNIVAENNDCVDVTGYNVNDSIELTVSAVFERLRYNNNDRTMIPEIWLPYG